MFDQQFLKEIRDAVKDAVKDGGRRMVACEPVVSVLTEIAKTLQPGRCVT